MKSGATTNPVTASKSGPTGASTSPTSTASGSVNSGSPAATSTPDTLGSTSAPTPVATDTPGTQPVAALTVQINNPPSSVQNRTTTDISIMTNIGTIPFQFEADYYSGFSKLRQSDSINGTTDGSGNATVSWTPSLPPGLILLHTYANLHVTATDQNGKSVSVRTVQVQITRF